MTRIELPRQKQVGHLTLHRQPRTINSKEFNALSQSERLQLLQSVSGRQKYNLLIEAADAVELLQQLPPQELYLLVRELGGEDVPELVAMASPEQLTALIDLDCWEEDQLQRDSALRWLSLLLDGEEAQVAETLAGLDAELLIAILQQWVKVVSGPEDIDDEDARIEAMTRDGGYALEYSDSEAAKPIGKLLKVLLSQEKDLYLQLLEGIRQELPMQLEEELYRWRSGRLADFGFADPHQAKSVYAWLDPATFRAEDYRREGRLYTPGGHQPPGYLLAEVSPRPLLAEILARGIDADAAWELTFLLNKLMTADGVDPGDSSQVAATLERLYATLNLALEQLAGQDSREAAAVFDSIYFEYLFRLGFSLTLQRKRRAEALLRAPFGGYIDLPLRPALELLVQPRPEFYLPLEGSSREQGRNFASLKELELVDNLLARLEVQRQLAERELPQLLPDPEDFDLSGCEPDSPEQLGISELFLTALANQLLGREFAPVPLPLAEVAQLHELVTENGQLAQSLLQQTRDWLEGLTVGGGRFADWVLAIWDEEFCPLEADELNPRYLSGMIVRID